MVQQLKTVAMESQVMVGLHLQELEAQAGMEEHQERVLMLGDQGTALAQAVQDLMVMVRLHNTIRQRHMLSWMVVKVEYTAPHVQAALEVVALGMTTVVAVVDTLVVVAAALKGAQ
jgi:hypothetical protein